MVRCNPCSAGTDAAITRLVVCDAKRVTGNASAELSVDWAGSFFAEGSTTQCEPVERSSDGNRLIAILEVPRVFA